MPPISPQTAEFRPRPILARTSTVGPETEFYVLNRDGTPLNDAAVMAELRAAINAQLANLEPPSKTIEEERICQGEHNAHPFTAADVTAQRRHYATVFGTILKEVESRGYYLSITGNLVGINHTDIARTPAKTDNDRYQRMEALKARSGGKLLQYFEEHYGGPSALHLNNFIPGASWDEVVQICNGAWDDVALLGASLACSHEPEEGKRAGRFEKWYGLHYGGVPDGYDAANYKAPTTFKEYLQRVREAQDDDKILDVFWTFVRPSYGKGDDETQFRKFSMAELRIACANPYFEDSIAAGIFFAAGNIDRLERLRNGDLHPSGCTNMETEPQRMIRVRNNIDAAGEKGFDATFSQPDGTALSASETLAQRIEELRPVLTEMGPEAREAVESWAARLQERGPAAKLQEQVVASLRARMAERGRSEEEITRALPFVMARTMHAAARDELERLKSLLPEAEVANFRQQWRERGEDGRSAA